MPISPIVLQRRMVELGRIRLGHKVTGTNAAGQEYTRPDKLDRFRFTSPSHQLIQDIAQLYGGQAKPWDNQGKAEFEVLTEAREIPVIVVKGGLSQWMETWSGGGCIHRCDGERNVLTDAPCDLEERVQVGRKTINPHAEARPTTRLSVMLSDVEGLGVWRMETHGWNAAAEIPDMAEFAMHVGSLVPATLRLVERTAIRDGETKQFVVPVLDLQVTKAELVQIMGTTGGGAPAQVGNGTVKQIEAPPEPAEMPDYASMVEAATTEEDLQTIWHRAGQAGELTQEIKDAMIARARELHPSEPAAEEVEVETVDDGEAAAEAAWMLVVTEAGKHGWTTHTLTDAFQQWAAVPLADGDAVMFTDFLAAMRRGEIATVAS